MDKNHRIGAPLAALAKTLGSAVAALIVLAVVAVAVARPSAAQTSVNCITAAEIAQAAGEGAPLRLTVTYAAPSQVESIIDAAFGKAEMDHADTVQVFRLGAGGYLVMASVQGCHVAHRFVAEEFVRGLNAA